MGPPSISAPASVVEERISSERDASPMSIVPSAAQFNAAKPNSKSKTSEKGPGDDRTPSKAILMLTGHSSEVSQFDCYLGWWLDRTLQGIRVRLESGLS